VDKTELRTAAVEAQVAMDLAWARYQEACAARKAAFLALQAETGHGKPMYGQVSAFCRDIGLTRSSFYKVLED
jgi:hypothetical protein